MKRFTRGERLTADMLNDLPDDIIAELIEHGIVAGPGIRLARLAANRLSISADLPAGVAPAIEPFQAIAYGIVSGTARIRVKEGTINDLTDGAGLTVVGKTGSPPSGWWEFQLPAASTRYGVADATIATDGTVSAAKFQLYETAPLTGAGDPDTGAPPPHSYRKLFKVVVDNNYVATVTQYAKGSQQCKVIVTAWACDTITKDVVWLP